MDKGRNFSVIQNDWRRPYWRRNVLLSNSCAIKNFVLHRLRLNFLTLCNLFLSLLFMLTAQHTSIYLSPPLHVPTQYASDTHAVAWACTTSCVCDSTASSLSGEKASEAFVNKLLRACSEELHTETPQARVALAKVRIVQHVLNIMQRICCIA